MLTFLLAQATDAIKIDLAGQFGQQEHLTTTDSHVLFGNFINTLLGGVVDIGLLSVFIFLIWGSIEWITAGGDKTKVETARNKITGSVIGLIVLLSSLAIFFLVQQLLGVQLFRVGNN